MDEKKKVLGSVNTGLGSSLAPSSYKTRDQKFMTSKKYSQLLIPSPFLDTILVFSGHIIQQSLNCVTPLPPNARNQDNEFRHLICCKEYNLVAA